MCEEKKKSMHAIIVAGIFCALFVLLFAGCATTGKNVQTDYPNGAETTSTAIQQQSNATSAIGVDSQAITDSGTALAITGSDIAREIEELSKQLQTSGSEEREFADIIRRVQERPTIDYKESNVTNTKSVTANTETAKIP